ncbi:MAG: triphosphatase [Oleiphilaceae bacterium]|jgi:inorganic triphosphatase YgiF
MVTGSNPSYYSMMNHEIELKLRLNARELPLLEKALNSPQFISEPTLKLLNRYFDTPQMGLSKGGAALRIRQQGTVDLKNGGVEGVNATHALLDERIIQTLKTRGTSAAGLHQRMEWDWPLTKVELDLGLIQNGDANNHLSPALSLEAITPLFTTDFQRKVWMYHQGETLIELVLDQGEVSTDEHRIDLLELELELKQGQPEVLFQVAQQIADQCPVLMSDISKAERGYGLLALSTQYSDIKKDWAGRIPNFDEEEDVIGCFKTFFAFQLTSFQRSLELGIWDGQHDKQAQTMSEITLLHNLLSLFTHIDCLPDAQLLQRQLNQASQAPFELSRLWGQLSLACGYWLFSLSSDCAKFKMTAEEKMLMNVHVEQLTQGMRL